IISIAGICISLVPLMTYFAVVFGILAIVFSIITFCKKGSTAKSVTSLILGILSVIISVAMLIGLLALGSDTKEAPKEAPKEDATVTFGEFIIEEGSYSTSTELPVTITNTCEKRKSFIVKIEAVDKNGDRIEEDIVLVSDLSPGQSATEKAFRFISSEKLESIKEATFQVIDIDAY
ncbi:MAG: hypothetical protein KBS52_06830, partial [Clostridiales bacterium]|nr:hypothetical protein [Candidatus Equinaster intestinalis]